MTQLAKVDPIELATQQIEEKLPEKFSFSIPECYLVGLTDIQLAINRAAMMRKFEQDMGSLHYQINHSFDDLNREWVYLLRREALDI